MSAGMDIKKIFALLKRSSSLQDDRAEANGDLNNSLKQALRELGWIGENDDRWLGLYDHENGIFYQCALDKTSTASIAAVRGLAEEDTIHDLVRLEIDQIKPIEQIAEDIHTKVVTRQFDKELPWLAEPKNSHLRLVVNSSINSVLSKSDLTRIISNDAGHHQEYDHGAE